MTATTARKIGVAMSATTVLPAAASDSPTCHPAAPTQTRVYRAPRTTTAAGTQSAHRCSFSVLKSSTPENSEALILGGRSIYLALHGTTRRFRIEALSGHIFAVFV